MAHQAAILQAQLELAGHMNRPVSVHGVQAHGVLYDTIASSWKGHEKEVLSRRQKHQIATGAEDFSDDTDGDSDHEPPLARKDNPPKPLADSGRIAGRRPFPPRICLHSYSGYVEQLKMYIHPKVPAKVYFSFSMAINWGAGGGDKTEEAIRAIPDDRLLVESDLHVAGEQMDRNLEALSLALRIFNSISRRWFEGDCVWCIRALLSLPIVAATNRPAVVESWSVWLASNLACWLADWPLARNWCATNTTSLCRGCPLTVHQPEHAYRHFDRHTPVAWELTPPQRARYGPRTLPYLAARCRLSSHLSQRNNCEEVSTSPRHRSACPRVLTPTSCPRLPSPASCAPAFVTACREPSAMYAGYGYPNNPAGSPQYNGSAPPPGSQNSAMQPGASSNQMMYNTQQFPMGAQSAAAFPGNPNMMAGVGPSGMMQNTGMPHMAGANGQMSNFQPPYSNSAYGAGIPSSVPPQMNIPPNYTMGGANDATYASISA
ncbi:hypothetical protein NUW58_g9732 [Xylaria curta]|uniref:Uncharacterized protein n=1 Tax=Xylaria curta TaxID=42375 RepID=A0ACC1MTZ9_9PEZI|nr:hypothetical protein NUW58_g9732 [Xylaria curta]